MSFSHDSATRLVDTKEAIHFNSPNIRRERLMMDQHATCVLLKCAIRPVVVSLGGITSPPTHQRAAKLEKKTPLIHRGPNIIAEHWRNTP